MALVLKGYEMTVTVKDLGADTSTLRYALDAATMADAITAGGAIITDLTAVCEAPIVRYAIAEVYEDNVPVLAGEVSTQAVIVAKINSTQDKYATLKIPSPVAGIFSGASGKLYNVVDPADPALVAYLENFETGASATVSDGEHLADMGTPANITGRRVHRGGRG